MDDARSLSHPPPPFSLSLSLSLSLFLSFSLSESLFLHLGRYVPSPIPPLSCFYNHVDMHASPTICMPDAKCIKVKRKERYDFRLEAQLPSSSSLLAFEA